jgi:hypothetical protein
LACSTKKNLATQQTHVACRMIPVENKNKKMYAFVLTASQRWRPKTLRYDGYLKPPLGQTPQVVNPVTVRDSALWTNHGDRRSYARRSTRKKRANLFQLISSLFWVLKRGFVGPCKNAPV